jgi:hypothetical protein
MAVAQQRYLAQLLLKMLQIGTLELSRYFLTLELLFEKKKMRFVASDCVFPCSMLSGHSLMH